MGPDFEHLRRFGGGRVASQAPYVSTRYLWMSADSNIAAPVLGSKSHGTCIFRNFSLFNVGYVHDDTAFEHLGQPGFDFETALAGGNFLL